MGFSAYLQSVIADYEKLRDRYVLTDLQVEYREEKRRSPDDPERQPEKQVERLEVLAGLLKYVQKGHVLLVGKPGSGKSTALQRLRWELAQAALMDEQQPIPVLVALRSLRHTFGILEAIAFRLQKGDPDLDLESKDIKRFLLKGRLFLLLDGVNEIPSDGLNSNVISDVISFRGDFSKAPMIFTSREVGAGLGIGQKLEMCGLTESQMRSFVQNYLSGDYAEVLLHQWKDQLRELAETPLLLKLLCDVFDPKAPQIPQGKGELFRAVDAKFNDWKQQEGVRTTEEFWRWNGEILRYLAFAMLRADGTPTGKWLQIERDHAEHLLEEFLQDRVTAPGEKAKDWLQDLLEHHLLQPATNPNQIEFHHQLFEEYYAAEYLLQQLPHLGEAKLKHDYLNLLKWTEPLAVMLSLVRDEKLAVQIVKLALDIDWMLGARLAGEVSPDFQQQTVALISEIKDVPQWLKVELWGRTHSSAAIEKLEEAIKSADERISGIAAYALANLGSEAAIPALSEALKSPDKSVDRMADRSIRGWAATGLSNIGSQQAIQELVQALKDSNEYTRKVAAYALADIGSEEAIPVLEQILQQPDKFDRRMAVEHLETIRSKSTIETLIEALKDPDFSVRSSASDVLSRISSENGLLQMLENSNESVREGVAIALGKVGSETGISALLRLINDPSPDVCQCAAQALRDVSSKAAIPVLTQALQDPNPTVRQSAVSALGNAGSPEVIPALLPLLQDPEPSVRESVVTALGQVGSQAVVPVLLQTFRQTWDWNVGDSIILALGEIGSELAIPTLLQINETLPKSYELRWIGQIEPFDPCCDLHWMTRFCLVTALGKISSKTITPELLQALIQALADPKGDVRREAAQWLGKIRVEKAIPDLVRATQDAEKDVRWAAVMALGEIGSEVAISELKKIIEDSNSDMQRQAVQALGITRSATAISILLKLVENPENDLCRWAVEALGELKSLKVGYVLSDLRKLLDTQAWNEAFLAIPAIQANCQFYNYEIFQLPPEPEPPTVIDLHSKIDKIDQRTKHMAEQPSISIGTISGGIQNFTPNQGTQTNTNIGTQNNYFGTDDNLKQQIADLKQFIAELEAKHPQVQTETAANDIIDAEIVAVQKTDINRWQILRQQMLLLKRQFLNPERQLQALKAGLGEAAKHYLEDSVWAKAILTYIDKLSETPDQGA